jgi:MoxR-like ATPase
VLIDEIDKADIDFPNDLLHELDQPRFRVAEAPELTFAVPDEPLSLRPLVIITNNEEKTLPDAFLRRCVFHYVTFPDNPKDLDAILALHEIRQPELTAAAVRTLLELRALDLAKKPGLSELLDWVSYLSQTGTPIDAIPAVPHAGALIKQVGDQQRVDRWVAQR